MEAMPEKGKTLKERTTFRKVTADGKIEETTNKKPKVKIKKIVDQLREDKASMPKSVEEYKEQSQSMSEDYIGNLKLAVENGKKHFPKDFFIDVLTKSEQLIEGVYRNYFHPRVTCPDPRYDQALYKYNHKKEEIEFIWVVPDKNVCSHMYVNRFNTSSEDFQLLPYVVDFVEGRLHLKQVKYNKKVERTL